MAVPQLSRRLTLERQTRVSDNSGGFNVTWEPVGTLWAEIRPGSGGERLEDFLKVSRVPYRITVRAAPAGSPSRPQPDQRLREGMRTFRILAVSDRDSRGRYLTLFTEEEVVA